MFLPTSEVVYIAAGRNCSQSMWMKQMLNEYNVEQDVLTFYYNNLSETNNSKNPIPYSRTKHIDMRHHFIRDLVKEKIVVLEHATLEEQLGDIYIEFLDAKCARDFWVSIH